MMKLRALSRLGLHGLHGGCVHWRTRPSNYLTKKILQSAHPVWFHLRWGQSLPQTAWFSKIPSVDRQMEINLENELTTNRTQSSSQWQREYGLWTEEGPGETVL